MSACNRCGKTILFGGVKEDGLRFCSRQCRQAGELLLQSQRIPEQVVAQAMAKVVEGSCPVCSGPGPVDVFFSHRVFSAVVVTSWRSVPRVSCRGCATKAQLGSALYSFLLGWWGIPWGFLVTPVQIVRNLAGLAKDADRSRPSKELEQFVRARLADQALATASNVPENVARAA